MFLVEAFNCPFAADVIIVDIVVCCELWSECLTDQWSRWEISAYDVHYNRCANTTQDKPLLPTSVNLLQEMVAEVKEWQVSFLQFC